MSGPRMWAPHVESSSETVALYTGTTNGKPGTPAPERRAIQLIADDDLEAMPDDSPLVEDFAYENGLIALIGKYGTYKTFILLELAFCIAVGADWHGRRVQQGLVVYVYAEGRHGIGKRLTACKAAYQFTGPAGIYFLPRSLIVSDPGQIAAFLLAIQELPELPVAVFIDTVSRNMAGNENSVEDMGKFIRGCDKIRERTGAAVFLAHHTGWEAERSRGSTNLPASVDTEILVDRDDMIVTLKCTKQKEGPEFAPIALEAFPIAGSLALKRFVPTRAELTRNERVALTVIQTAGALTSTQWLAVSDLAKGSFHNARKRLITLAYVKLSKNTYAATEAGMAAIGTTVNRGTNDGQVGRSDVVHSTGQVFRPDRCTTDPFPQGDLQ